MLNVKTRHDTYYVNDTVENFQKVLADKSQQFINIKGQLLKKSEIQAVRQAETQKPILDPFPSQNTLTEALRAENRYVLEYMKAMIPRYMKDHGRKLKLDEVRAVIAEARVSYNDSEV